MSNGQSLFPCNGNFYITRQIGSPVETNISIIDFIPNDIQYVNVGNLTPRFRGNSSAQFGGYIWAQNLDSADVGRYVLARVDATLNYTQFYLPTVTPVTGFNNGGVSKNGIYYFVDYTSPNTSAVPIEGPRLYAVNLTSGTPVPVPGYPRVVTGLSNGVSVVWGDIVVDPVTDRVYCWYHPTGTPRNTRGLYEIVNPASATPSFVKIGGAQDNILGTLFFNERGQLFGYGAIDATTTSVQDRLFAIDKNTGAITQYGLPDHPVSQSDGCECIYKLSLDRDVSTPILNIPRCGKDTVDFTFTLRNTTASAITNVELYDTLDSRLQMVPSQAALQTSLQSLFGGAVNVTIANISGGTKNRLVVTGLNVPQGAHVFTIPVAIDASNITSSFTATTQAWLKGLSPLVGGPTEPSNEPRTFNDKDGTAFTVNIVGANCLDPIAANFINHPIPQGFPATPIPVLPAADPDGEIASFKIVTVPPAAQGVLSYCSSGNNPCTGGFVNAVANNPLSLSQMVTLRFDPTNTFLGTTSFSFTAIDNQGFESNIANYELPITKQNPIVNNMVHNTLLYSDSWTTLNPVSFADADGTVQTILIKSLPAASAGQLAVDCSSALAGATCVGGSQVLTAAVLANYVNGIPLTSAQALTLSFDPAATFTGAFTDFKYASIDDVGNESSLQAIYRIPLSATPTLTRHPLADNIRAPRRINNSLGPVNIPPLTASDLDGAIANYAIRSIPPVSQGVVSIPCGGAYLTPAGATCTGGYAVITPAIIATNSDSIPLTIAQAAAGLRFDPDPSYTGTATFTYTATDNSGLTSVVASYLVNVYNQAPKAVNINTTAAFNGPAAAIIPISGSDLDGNIVQLRINSIPPASAGVLSIPCGGAFPAAPTGAACTGGFADLTSSVLAANSGSIALLPTQANGIRFDPQNAFSGTTQFSYSVVDNSGNTSLPGNYKIEIANQSPVANDITIGAIPMTSAFTPVAGLSAVDGDGTVVAYRLLTITPPTSGNLSMPCGGAAPTPAGGVCVSGRVVLTPAVLAANPAGIPLTVAQAASLEFDPALNYTGVVNFTYVATDNSGNTSNVAVFNIPISGVGNIAPVSKNIISNTVLATNSTLTMPSLSAADPDGTIAAFRIRTVSPEYKGTISVPCTVGTTPIGTTCTAGRAIITPAAVNAAGDAGLLITNVQASDIRFTPQVNFTGNFSFSYFAQDNIDLVSNTATYLIPVSGSKPSAFPVSAQPIPLLAGPSALPDFIGSDPDGTISGYFLDNIPPLSKGTLSTTCPPTFPTATCTGGFQDLAPSLVSLLPTGVPLTLAQMQNLRFDPSGNFEGNAIVFYHLTDNSGLRSNSAPLNVYIEGLLPRAHDVVAPKMWHGLAAQSIPPLVSFDDDGNIPSLFINSVPLPSQGVLSVACGGAYPAAPVGATCIGGFYNITSAVLAANPGGVPISPAQNNALRFDPTLGYNGDVIFNFTTLDNLANLTNIATYVIPIGRFNVLPIKLLNFNAAWDKDDIISNWTIDNEAAVAQYEVQISEDGIAYESAGNKTPNNLGQLTRYQLVLYSKYKPMYHVRLKMIARDGSVTYSNVVVLKRNRLATLEIFPNPVQKDFYVSLPKSGNYSFELFDPTGKLLLKKALTLQQGQRAKFDRLATFPSGLYLLRIADRDTQTVYSQKLMFR